MKYRIAFLVVFGWLLFIGAVTLSHTYVSYAKQQEAGCQPVGKVGNWSVSHCFDGYGHEFIANDAGFIAPISN